jgi:hypothetical protein
MAAHILQVGYYPTLLEIRALTLESAGYHVTSVSGNNEAMGLDGAVMATVGLVFVGFSAPHSVRTEIIHWFKEHYPKIPVIVLQSYGWEKFPEADAATLSEDPTVWMALVAEKLKASSPSN